MNLTTELEAVNSMLRLIDESPVATLTGEDVLDVVQARALLRDVNREVQSEGWRFNTDFAYPLAPQTPLPGIIQVPLNCLKLDPADERIDAVQRDGKLWNVKDLTFSWAETVYCDIVWLFEYETIPETARAYVARVAGRRFVEERRDENSPRVRIAIRDEEKARARLEQAEALTAKANLANSPAVARVLAVPRSGRTLGTATLPRRNIFV